jgi:uncharacterized protein YbaR (Trm112 family)
MDCTSCPAGLLCVTGTLMEVVCCPVCMEALHLLVIAPRVIRVDTEDSVTQAVFHCYRDHGVSDHIRSIAYGYPCLTCQTKRDRECY